MIAAHFENRLKLIEFLGKALRRGRLALFLGAGLSKGLQDDRLGLTDSLPDWKGLIANLYTQHKKLPNIDTDLLKAAEEIRLEFYASDEAAWASAVSRALYYGVDLNFELIRKNDTLGAIAALVMSSTRGSVSQVVTFNFDDVLDRYLAYHGLVVVPTFEEKFWANKGDVVIYHPHGFLPSTGSPFRVGSDYVVLDRHSYSKRTGRSDLRMNQVMETILQSHICLFVGISGDDPRLDSLMVTTMLENKHAYMSGGIGYWGVAFSEAKNSKARAQMWKERGIFLHVVDRYEPDLSRFLFEICQNAAAQ